MRLAQDLIHDILERVPVKSLLRFKLVSKTWKMIIESQCFKERHMIRRQSQEPDILQIRYKDDDHYHLHNDEFIISILTLGSFDLMVDEDFQVELEFGLKMKLGFITTSCDGIVCIYNVRNTILLNPSTRWMRKLPLASIQSNWERDSNLKFILGFGKDIFTKTYKLVWFYNSMLHEDIKITNCEVFDFNTNTWRHLETSHYQILQYQFPVYVDGSLHWFIYNSDTEIKILSFNCHTEIFQVISKSPITQKSTITQQNEILIIMCNMDNRLCVSEKKWPTQDIWTLNCSNMTWKKILSLDLSSYPDDLLSDVMYPITILKNKKLLLGFQYDNLVIYDLETKSYSLYAKSGILVAPHFQSLISII